MTNWPADPVALPDCQLNWEALKKYLSQNVSLFQAGDLKSTFATTAPSGWVLLTGQTVNPIETVYPDLAKALGVTGSVTFPDGRGRAIIGAGTGGGLTARTIRSTGGTEPSNMPSHDHGGATGATDPVAGGVVKGAGGAFTGNAGLGTGASFGNVNGLNHTHSIAAQGGGADNMMPWVAANIMMKTSNS